MEINAVIGQIERRISRGFLALLLRLVDFVILPAGFICAFVSAFVEYKVFADFYQKDHDPSQWFLSVAFFIIISLEATKVFLIFKRKQVNLSGDERYKYLVILYTFLTGMLIAISGISTLLFSAYNLHNPEQDIQVGKKTEQSDIDLEKDLQGIREDYAQRLADARGKVSSWEKLLADELARPKGGVSRGIISIEYENEVKKAKEDLKKIENEMDQEIQNARNLHKAGIGRIRSDSRTSRDSHNKLLSAALQVINMKAEYPLEHYILLIGAISLSLSICLESIIIVTFTRLAIDYDDLYQGKKDMKQLSALGHSLQSSAPPLIRRGSVLGIAGILPLDCVFILEDSESVNGVVRRLKSLPFSRPELHSIDVKYTSYEESGGGVVANILAYLGASGEKASICGVVGDDKIGAIVREDLKSHKVKLDSVKIDASKSTSVISIVNTSDERKGQTVLHQPSLLFSMDLKFRVSFDSGSIPSELSQEFESYGILSTQKVTVENKGDRWLLIDEDNKQSYTIRRKDGKLSLYTPPLARLTSSVLDELTETVPAPEILVVSQINPWIVNFIERLKQRNPTVRISFHLATNPWSDKQKENFHQLLPLIDIWVVWKAISKQVVTTIGTSQSGLIVIYGGLNQVEAIHGLNKGTIKPKEASPIAIKDSTGMMSCFHGALLSCLLKVPGMIDNPESIMAALGYANEIAALNGRSVGTRNFPSASEQEKVKSNYWKDILKPLHTK